MPDSPPSGTRPRIRRVLETALYADDLEVSAAFYVDVLGLGMLSSGERMVALDAGQGTVLLLFRRGSTAEGAHFGGGWIPGHGADGSTHFALAIDEDDLDAWRERLRSRGVAVESEVTWPRGGRSLYFRDPDGHSVELASPGLWETY